MFKIVQNCFLAGDLQKVTKVILIKRLRNRVDYTINNCEESKRSGKNSSTPFINIGGLKPELKIMKIQSKIFCVKISFWVKISFNFKMTFWVKMSLWVKNVCLSKSLLRSKWEPVYKIYKMIKILIRDPAILFFLGFPFCPKC